MSSGNDAVFLRRNNQIQDAIDSQNMKQALQLIEKRMKKGENTPFLKAWKANVLFNHTDEAHKKRGIAETLELCKSEPPVTDLDTLDTLRRTLQKMDDQTDLRSALWERAAKAKPQDHDLQMRWFTDGFEGRDWKSAQKAAMSLQKNFPRERKYYFWAIFFCHIVSIDSASSDMDRKLFGTLAYRMISKAVAEVPTNPTELLSPPRAIQNAEELLLLIKIFEKQDKHDEILKILDSESAGLNSRIVNNDRIFVANKLHSLGITERWEEGHACAKSLLTVPEDEDGRKALKERDEWKFWNMLIASTRNLEETPGLLAETQEIIEKFIEFSPKSRNAHLARLDLTLVGIRRGQNTSDDLVSACQKYWDQHKHKLYLFGDFRGILETRDDSLVHQVCEYCMDSVEGKADDAIPLINAYKMQYYARLSGRDPSKSTIENLVRNCLDFYENFTLLAKTQNKRDNQEASVMESRPTDDFCLIAAMALLRPNKTSDQVSDKSLIRAAGILERLLVDSPHNYEAILILIRIYTLLGAGSLALKAFSKLSLKHVQYETVGHNLFTRFATIHPYSAPPFEGAEYKDFDPQAAFVQGLDFYRSANLTVSRSLMNGLREGSYANLEETIELRNRLNDSICRRILALETRRVQRLRKGEHLSFHEETAQSTSPAYDQRSYDAYMNLEHHSQPTFETRLRAGPVPKVNWLASARVTDQLFSVLKGIAMQKPNPIKEELLDISDLTLSETESDLTPTEVDASKINLELLKVANFMAGSKTHTSDQIAKTLGQVEVWLNDKKQGLVLQDDKKSPLIENTTVEFDGTPAAPTWRYFHAIWSLVESLKALSNIITLDSRKAVKTTKLPDDHLKRVSALVCGVFEDVRSNTRALKRGLSESANLSTVIDLVMQGDADDKYEKPLQDVLNRMMDASAVEVFCGELRESWEEALDGVMAAKI
ncbi:uncharacterized protein N7446_000599 [Penicillium canescens]|uniref:Uncharacterized protein n=1 Tax=Penicillium canescens TaxID=5083 RepID=A0AAD6N5B9_PENCN|nr:uncharacterized protein N7446_000599 [Penicillium canescens]KAJ6030340.1 hypothetical protein N7460_010606 [Penicillium canescens]KAJ6060712.1 hypothetical protein N7444_002566 [Penicillium canescens]KAJ6077663.1 hypothetical protein N7446_000599 [Penicillium canescens]